MVLAVGGCDSPPALRLDSVDPGRVPYGVSSQIHLRGVFAPGLSLDLSDKGQSTTLVDEFQVEVGTEQVTSVRLLSPDTLEVGLPPELTPGLYDLEVTDPRGTHATLAKGLEVYVLSPARIAFATSMRAVGVGAWSEPIRVELRDALDHPSLAPHPMVVRVTSDSPTGWLSADRGQTFAQSLNLLLRQGAPEVELSFKDDSAGYVTLVASTDGLDSISQPVVVGDAGDAAKVRFVGNRAPVVTAGNVSQVSVEIEDAGDGPAIFPDPGIRVDLLAAPGLGLSLVPGGPFTPALSLVLHEGMGRAGLYVQGQVAGLGAQLQASATEPGTGRVLAPDTLSFSILHGPLSGFEVLRSSAADATAGAPEHFTVRAVDGFGNTVDDWSGMVALAARPAVSPNAMGPGAMGANVANGYLVQDVTFTAAQQAVLAVSDQAIPPHFGRSEPFWVRPGPFAGYALSTPDSLQVAGVPFMVTLAALDAYGNPITEPRQVKLAVPGLSADAFSPASSGPFTGSVTLQVAITRAASNLSLVAGDASAQATSGSFSVLPGSLQRFEVSDVSGDPIAGAPFGVTVRALDAYGNETLDANDVALSADGAAPTAVSPATSGSFVGHVNLKVAITQALSGTRLAVGNAQASGQQTSPFNVLPGPLSRFDLFPPACVTSTAAFTLDVQASDAYGNRVTGYGGTVHFSAQTRFSPGTSPAFTAGAVSILNATLSRVGTVPRTVTLQAVDSTDPTRTGSVALNVQAFCP